MVIYVTSTVRVTYWMSYDASANHDGTMNNHDEPWPATNSAKISSKCKFFSCKCLAFIFTLEDIIVDFRSAVPKFVVNISNYVSKLWTELQLVWNIKS